MGHEIVVQPPFRSLSSSVGGEGTVGFSRPVSHLATSRLGLRGSTRFPRIQGAMTPSRGQETCWTLIHAAAAGSQADRALFARRYLPIVRSYLAVRWQDSPRRVHVDDAAQEVFLECFREQGVLAKADPHRPGGFRRFLLGVVRNVAARVEKRSARRRARRDSGSFHPERMPSDDKRPSQVFERAWAQAIMEQALQLQERRAAKADDASRQRIELLRLRFEEGLPIREIAARWGQDPPAVHGAYRKAREEFKECLQRVVLFHNPGAAENPDRECRELLSILE